jgi:hypothetical protein
LLASNQTTFCLSICTLSESSCIQLHRFDKIFQKETIPSSAVFEEHTPASASQKRVSGLPATKSEVQSTQSVDWLAQLPTTRILLVISLTLHLYICRRWTSCTCTHKLCLCNLQLLSNVLHLSSHWIPVDLQYTAQGNSSLQSNLEEPWQ